MLYKILPYQIHLWQIKLNPDNAELLISDCRKILPLDEQTRADRFVFEKHRRRFIFAHFGLRKILANYLNLSPEMIQFETLAHGKPQLIPEQNTKNIQFNLSHSGETALVGLRTEKAIGVDIEYHSDREFLEIAESVFSDLECHMLSKIVDKKEKIVAFFHIWTQKEAFIKAIGEGLSYPLKDFSVSAKTPAKLIEAKHENITDWYFHSFQPNIQSQATIATFHPVESITSFDFSYIETN